MANLYKGMAGSPITSLSAAITSTQTSITVDNGSTLPDAPNICTIVGDSAQIETILYTAKSGDVLSSVTRGVEGTAKAWPAGTEVARYFTAYDQNAIVQQFAAPEWHELPLINDWTGHLYCAKNALNQVTIEGNIYPKASELVTHRMIVAELPGVYRPKGKGIGIPVFCINVGPYGGMIGFVIDDTGFLRVVDPLADKLKSSTTPEQKTSFNVIYMA